MWANVLAVEFMLGVKGARTLLCEQPQNYSSEGRDPSAGAFC